MKGSNNRMKIVIVGGSSGIGLALAESLLNLNHQIIIASRNKSKLSHANNSLHNRATTYQLDASDEIQVTAFLENIGPIDHLISTVKPIPPVFRLTDSSLGEIRDAFENKFWAQLNLAKLSSKFIRQGGSITLTSGASSAKPIPEYSTYKVINRAVEALVESLVPELNPIRINAVCPGFINSSNSTTQLLNSYKGSIPISRLGDLDEIIQSYLYLLRSSYTTGVILRCDGGFACS